MQRDIMQDLLQDSINDTKKVGCVHDKKNITTRSTYLVEGMPRYYRKM